MAFTSSKDTQKKPAPAASSSALESPALEWLWKYLGDVPQPQILDCGTVKPQTVDLLLRRHCKVFVADLVSPLQKADPRFWDRTKKDPVFLVDDFLAGFPNILPGSLNAIFCWHLFDLLPRDALQKVVNQLFSCLQLGGVMFCLLREPYLRQGADAIWRLETLTALAGGGEGSGYFANPVLSGRELERLLPEVSLKSFLTRSGRREVLVLR